MERLRSVFASADLSLAGFFKSAFRDSGMDGMAAHSAGEFRKALEEDFDALLLDASAVGELMGSNSAEEAVSGLRKLYPGKVIIALADNASSSGDVVALLNAGASEVVCKPPRFRVLAEQVKSLVRFARPAARPVRSRLSLDDGAIVLDTPARRCFLRAASGRAPEEVRLTRNEFRILAELIGNKGKMVSYDDFSQEVWNHT
ncbi:MAG: winged helix-turn-helix domain-containing protein [Elusimicrobiota bacterium]|nr:winged helix-turn-helix domain-containing protein [Elusimicrobiota bacterium]